MSTSYYGHTTVHPVGLAALLALAGAVLLVKRQHVLIPFFVMACFVAPAQRIVIAGLDFTFLRMLTIVAWLRILLRKEYGSTEPGRIDVAITIWTAVRVIVYAIQQQSTSGLIYMLGESVDSLGVYMVAKWTVRDRHELHDILVAIAILSVPVVCFLLVEKSTGHNLFSMFGGVPAITMVREGRLRVQGAFAHPILAGCFWAAILPMAIASIGVTQRKSVFVVGSAAIGLIVVLCASSTPIVGVLVGLIGMLTWKIRTHMREVRWLILAMILGLSVVMNHPVWHLLTRIDFSGGSTGWHRYFLIDQAIRHFKDWALFGLADITYWNVFANDITNQYVLEAVTGGLVSLALFIWLIVEAFRSVGAAAVHPSTPSERSSAFVVWSLGVSVLVHAVNFIGVSYFGQITMLWYATLGMISAICATAAATASRRAAVDLYPDTTSILQPNRFRRTEANGELS